VARLLSSGETGTAEENDVPPDSADRGKGAWIIAKGRGSCTDEEEDRATWASMGCDGIYNVLDASSVAVCIRRSSS